MSKKMRFEKKVVAIMLIISIVFSIRYDIMAIENDLIKVDKENLNECIIVTALDWANFLYPELDMEIGDVHQINVSYDSDEIEYSVAYFVGVIPYGYSVISFIDGQAVVKESMIERGVEGIYTNLIDIVDEKSEYDYRDLKIIGNVVELAPMKYCVVTENLENEIISYDNLGMVHDEYDSSYAAIYHTIDGFYIQSSNWTSTNYDVDSSTEAKLEYYSSGKMIFGQQAALINTGSYACSVQALYNISHWCGINGYSAVAMQQEYPKIWDCTNSYEIASPAGYEDYTFGATYFSQIEEGFLEYLADNGKKNYANCDSEAVYGKPSEAWMRTHLKDNEPIVYCYEVENSAGNIEGHTVAVIGIMDAEKVSSGNTWTYLMVADGWHATPTYFNYDYVELESYKAISFIIK